MQPKHTKCPKVLRDISAPISSPIATRPIPSTATATKDILEQRNYFGYNKYHFNNRVAFFKF